MEERLAVLDVQTPAIKMNYSKVPFSLGGFKLLKSGRAEVNL